MTDAVDEFRRQIEDDDRKFFPAGTRSVLRKRGLALLDETDAAGRADLSESVLLLLRPLGALPDYVLDRLGRVALLGRLDGAEPLQRRLAQRVLEPNPPELGKAEQEALAALEQTSRTL